MMRSKTPPLLRRMLEHQVGELVVRRGRITEPKTGCCVARDFPNDEAAIAAAKEMNEVADWVGIIKTRADGRSPNCQDELQRIAEAHGGNLGTGGGTGSEVVCAKVVTANRF